MNNTDLTPSIRSGRSSAPEVSVVIPVHNAAAFIGDALRSVSTQSFRSLEIVVIDDGSTDNTVAEIAKLDDPRLVLIHQPHGGVVAAANRALDHVRGRYLARLDADDLMIQGRIASQVQFLDAHPDVCVVGTAYELFGEQSGVVRMPRTDRACRQRLRLSACFAHSTVMMRTAVLQRHNIRYRPETHGLSEDYALWCDIAP